MNKDAIFEACARAAHEVNRAYCIALGDLSQVPWHEAPAWQRESALKGVHGVLVDGNGPGASHESWLKEKEETGWKYGPVKDPEKKEHPCFVPFEELPEDQQMKDVLFVNTVRTMGAALGWESKTPTVESRLRTLEKRIDDLTLVVESRIRPSPAIPEALSIADDNPEMTADILHLVLEEDFPQAAIDAWAPEQRIEAERWAAAQHALASDNHLDPDEIPAKPVHVTELQKKYPQKKSYIGEVGFSMGVRDADRE